MKGARKRKTLNPLYIPNDAMPQRRKIKKNYSSAMCLYSNTEKVGKKTFFFFGWWPYATSLEVSHQSSGVS